MCVCWGGGGGGGGEGGGGCELGRELYEFLTYTQSIISLSPLFV